MITRLIVQRSATAFVSKYEIHVAGAGLERSAPVAWASRRRLSHGEITVYRDDTKSQPLWTVTFEQATGGRPHFAVKDLSGQQIGTFRLGQGAFPFGHSIQLLNAQNKPTFKISESSQGIAVSRRAASKIPIVNRLRDKVSSLLDYHLVVTNAAGEIAGKYVKSADFDNNYEWRMTDSAWQSSDWRVIVSALICIDEL